SLDGGSDRATGAPVNIVADGGTVNIGGTLDVDTSGSGRDDFFIIRDNGNTGIGEDAVGGAIGVSVVNGGDLTVGGLTTLDASAQGGKGEVSSGSATGGNVSVTIGGAGSAANFAGGMAISTAASDAAAGKIGGGGTAAQGSDSTAGNVSLIVNGGTLDAGFVQIDATADATSGGDSTIVQDNKATSGDITIRFTGGTQDLGNIQIFSNTIGATSFDATGNAYESTVSQGAVDFLLDGSQTSLAQDFSVYTGSSISDPAAAVTTEFRITNGTQLTVGGNFSYSGNNPNDAITLTVDGGSTVNVSGVLGFYSSGSTNSVDASQGTTITLNIDNASVTAAYVELNSSLTNNSFENVDVSGGIVGINLTNGASLDAGTLYIDSNAFASATGSNASGGQVSILVDSSTLRATGGMFISANGLSAPSAVNGTNINTAGRGGTVIFTLTGSNPVAVLGDLGVTADGSFGGFSELALGAGSGSGSGGASPLVAYAPLAGGSSGLGDGGNAAGGSVTFNLDSGSFTAGDMSISSSGYGEDGSSGIYDDGVNPPVGYAGKGGTGTGGDVTLNLNGASLTANSLVVSANGLGGYGGYGDFDFGGSAATGAAAGDGGDGIGGNATINANSGTINVPTIAIRALGNAEIFTFSNTNYLYTYGSGGYGFGVNGGNGGNGTGGTATFNLVGDAVINTVNVDVDSTGYGGLGGGSYATFDVNSVQQPGGLAGRGGNATGGTSVFNDTSGTIGFQQFNVSANAFGGTGGDHSAFSSNGATDNGGDGGDATAGSATVNLNQAETTGAGFGISAYAIGGAGGSGLVGGGGGAAQGGAATLNVNNVAVVVGNLLLDTSALGGDGGAADNPAGDGGVGGNATAGTSRLYATGPDASFTASSPIAISAEGQGGLGAAGGSNPNDTGVTGNGGAGGSGTGGLVQVVANAGATIDYSVDSSTAAGGFGGDGGAGGDAPLVAAGNGGVGGDGTGGRIEFTSTGGSVLNVSAAGDNLLDAKGRGGDGGNGGLGPSGSDGNPGRNGAAHGGSVGLAVDTAGGQLNFAGNLIIDVSGMGLQDQRANALGNDASGGDVLVAVSNGGAFSVDGGMWVDASAQASIGALGGGNAIGGDVVLQMAGAASTFDISGAFDLSYPIGPSQRSLYIDASAYEPQSGSPLIATLDAGDQTGGTISIDFADGDSGLAAGALLRASAGDRNPSSGSEPDPVFFLSNGTATAGSIGLTLTGGVHRWWSFSAESNAYNPGGTTIGGRIDALIDGGQLFLAEPNALFGLSTLIVGENATTDPQAITLTLANGALLSAPQIALYAEAHPMATGATVRSGNVDMLVDNSAIVSSTISLTTDAQAFFVTGLPGIGNSGADALAGDVSLTIRNGSNITGDVTLTSFARGDNSAGGDGGSATSGALTYVLDTSTHTGVGSQLLSFVSVAQAQGASAPGATSGFAQGGDQTVTITGAATLTGGQIDLQTTTYGSEASGNQVGTAPGGAGGTINVNFFGGTANISGLNITSNVGAAAGGTGGGAGAALRGSDVIVSLLGTALTVPSIAVSTSVIGSNGGNGNTGGGPLDGGAGGDSFGGNVLLLLNGGSLVTGDIFVITSALGGTGGNGVVDETLLAAAPGGVGGAGGDGIAGNIVIDATVDLGSLTSLSANATGTGGA
ncbi:MAG: hypothetical protein IE921_17570, partial [Rhodobacteraceae bacterium]|nr:hypothetical protein [Paracoccaceae bacterium]